MAKFQLKLLKNEIDTIVSFQHKLLKSEAEPR